MKSTKALLAVLLAASMLSTSLFTACSKKDDGDTKDVNNNDVTDNSDKIDENVDPLTLDHSPNVPADVKFDGQTFGILIGSTGQHMYAEEETADITNNEVYNDNLIVEDRFGITLNIVKGGYAATGEGQKEATAQVRSLIEANDTTYHAFIHVQHTGMPQMILEKYFVDWNTLPYINLEEDWWYQNITNDLCFGDKIYVMTGDYAMYIKYIDCLVFNKDIFDELDLEYPYQDVLDGTWTWDKFEELVAKGAKDLNGDGQMDIDNDRWGLVGWAPELGYALLVSTGFSPLEKDADNMPVLNQNVDRCHEMYDRIVDLFTGTKRAYFESDDYDRQNYVFMQGRAMFKDVFLSGITSFSDVEFDFGIIPYPKWDEESEYQNRSSNMTALTYIPVTNAELELTGAVLEEMAFQAAKNLTPAYFDIVLTVKNTRDVESEAMLPIIKNHARFLYGGYAPNIQGMILAGNNTYASAYASGLSTYQSDLEDMRALLLDEN